MTYKDHPLDVDLYDIAVHLRGCEDCRRCFSRVLYAEPRRLEPGTWDYEAMP